MNSSLHLGIDIGGTFTDFVAFDPRTGELRTFKTPSTPHDPAQAVLTGLEALPAALSITHGSTVATNALLERKGAPTALVTTRGFRDVLQIGRQNRPVLYDLTPSLPPPLVPAGLRLEVDERVAASGEVLIPLGEGAGAALVPALRAAGVEAVAVCLLFSFLHPEHEAALAAELRAAGFFVSVSHEILPEYREYERTATTVVNAYVSPVMDRYLARLEAALPETRLRVMQSNGGSISPGLARRQGVRCILSGPAGGLVAAHRLPGVDPSGEPLSEKRMTFDMGGTSTDVALVAGEPQVTTEAVIGGLPVRIPLLDIHTIGAGGGSRAYLDAGGALRVGPESAGADPGPACYGRGSLPTVTDANLVLGRLVADHFLGGQMPLYPERAEAALERLAEPLGLSPVEAALGVVAIANAHMERALRVISVERGHDPRDFTLVSFGGAGGLHAAALARRLGVPRVLVSPFASTFSALGMLLAEVVKDYAQTVMLPGETPAGEIEAALAPLLARGRADLLAEGVEEAQHQLQPLLDVRYRGQSYELTVPFSDAWRDTFERLHTEQYGYAAPGAALEVVNVRVRAVGRVAVPEIRPQPLAGPDPAAAFMGARPVVVSAAPEPVPHYAGTRLRPGNRFSGPAVVVRPDTTILVPAGDRASVDVYGNLWVEAAEILDSKA